MNINLYKIIDEQFNANDINFNGNENEYDTNIYNKEILDIQNICDKIFRKSPLTVNEIA